MPYAKSNQPKGERVPDLVDLSTLGSYEKVLQAFEQADRNGDKVLNFKELHALMLHLNKAKGNWTEEKTLILFTAIDRNKSGTIDQDEFVAYIFKRPGAFGGTGGMSEYEKVMEQFRSFDENRNGKLDKREFTQLMSTLKQGWEMKHTLAVFDVVDKDKSGEVDSAELVAYIFGVKGKEPSLEPVPQHSHKHHGAHGEAAKVLVLDFVYAPDNVDPDNRDPSQGHFVDNFAMQLKESFGDRVKVRRKVDPLAKTISHISAFDGKVVFWDHASMVTHRDDPFADTPSAKAFFKDLIARGVPRLLESLKVP